MGRKLLLVAAVFVLVRSATLLAYRDTLYYYGMIASQFAIAEAAYAGHAFAQDAVLASAAMDLATREGRFVAIEEWAGLQRSGRYTTFLAQDLPGFGYLIAATSRWFGDHLTTRYAMAAQVSVELASLLIFASCVAAAYGQRTAVLAGLVYSLAYPFVWPIASLPMRDVFVLGTFASFVGACFLFLRARGFWSAAGPGILLTIGSLLLWVRPSGYYFGAAVALPAALAGFKSLRARAAFVALLLLVPWLVFGHPYRLFNLRHYGVADADFLGRVLWAHMGIIEDNPYGFVLKDEALVPWVRGHYGREVEYGSPEMNRLLGDYARRVIREDPGYFLRTLFKRASQIAMTPLDVVPPIRLVEFGTSGRSLAEYARAHPASFAYKLVNRLVLTAFFYGGLALTVWLAKHRRAPWQELAVLMSPLAFTLAVQVLTAFEPRYMATGAWVLVLPWACGLEEWIGRRKMAR
jgi:hypothetical protein